MTDEQYMKLAIELAKKGAGFVNPNPMVGAIIVKNEKIISEAYHKEYGGFHAERLAINQCKNDMYGSTLYVTLEPCCHHGKTPPCTDIIIESGIKRVVIGCLDPNPKISGSGIEILKKAGIIVEVGILEDECKKLIIFFEKYIKTDIPYVTMKYAMTLDGNIATKSGSSKWISSDISRKHAHLLRNNHMAIMVGINTVLLDNPTLNCRIDENSKNPIRIICDTKLKMPLDNNICKTAKEIPTIIATSNKNIKLYKPYEILGIKIVHIPKYENHIDLKYLIKLLGEMGIDSILIEGGGMLNESALRCGLIDKIIIYIAPKLVGGKGPKGPITGIGVDEMSDAYEIINTSYTKLGNDLLVEGEVKYKCLLE